MIFTLRSGGTAHPETSVLQNITDLISSSGILSIAGNQFKAEAQVVPDMTVKIKIGRAYIKGSLTNSYPVRSDADENVTISPNSSGNPRIDTVVLYVDLSAAANSDASNVAKLTRVQGTPAASPVAPTTSEIQTAIGSANPFITLANIAVASGATSITNANITDIRSQAIFTIGGGGSTSFINNETPVGVVDGVNLVFTAAFPYVGFSLMVFRDGQLMVPGAAADYQETNPATGVFTFITAPAPGSVIRVSYQKVVSTTGNADTIDGFHANSTPTPNQLLPLDGSGLFPASVLANASGGGGNFEDFIDQGSDPAAPVAGKTRFYEKLGVFNIRRNTPGDVGMATPDAGHFTITPGTGKLVKVALLRQNQAASAVLGSEGAISNTFHNNAIILTGWGYATNAVIAGTFAFSRSISFGLTFTTTPVIVTNALGWTNSGVSGGDNGLGSFGNGLDADKSFFTNAVSCSATGFIMTGVKHNVVSFLGGNSWWGFSWIAIGQL